jgi:4-amino-4-deoxy-L-arabinose transferase-like glycosyltransferase
VTEREWREAADLQSSRWAVGAVLGTAVLLRFWNLSSGVPYAVGVDEPEIMDRVVGMMRTGDFNPHFFDYPGLYFYVQLAVACLRFIVGATGGRWYALDQADVGDFYVWGRATTALLGAATVLVVYLAGLRWGTRHALLAAGLMAVIPLHVRESHYVLTDVPMTLFVALTLLLSLRANEKPTLASFALAGVAAGLAGATKYNGVTALVLPICVAYASPSDTPTARLSRAAVSAGACVAAFLIAAPYTVLDLPAFLNAYAGLAKHYRPSSRVAEPTWLTYLKYLRSSAMGWPAAILAGIGLVLAIVRAFTGPGHVRSVLLVAFPVVYFYLIATRSLVFGRYLMPIVPFTCLLAAIAVVSGVSLLRRFSFPRNVRTALIAGGTIAAVLPPLVTAVRFDSMLGHPTTQQQAYTWIRANVPAGSRIVVEGRIVQLPEEKYRVKHVQSAADADVQAYRDEHVDFVVASSRSYGVALQSPQSQPTLFAKYRTLFNEAEPVFVATESPTVSGPEIRVLKLAK